ncbi:pyrroloquinoline quinone precursor peptide PqqA [Streptomyces chattanoogensis]|uniref:pyrroloquinoline quinone precursor peptide PqqA n=1 Tax=Streptomyces chattanoogensis TaxID=66876 RepID=UPI0036AA8F5E
MNHALEQSPHTAPSPHTSDNPQPQPATRPNAPYREQTVWQTPGYTVIETALEVTAYSLNAR